MWMVSAALVLRLIVGWLLHPQLLNPPPTTIVPLATKSDGLHDPSWKDPLNSKTELHQMQRLGELAYMEAKRDETLTFIREHPGIFAWLTLKRIAFFWTGIWNLSPDYLLATPWDTLYIPFSLTLSLLAAAGLRRMFRECQDAAWVFALVLLATPVSYYVTSVTPRYRHPLDPFVVMLAVATVVENTSQRRARCPSAA